MRPVTLLAAGLLLSAVGVFQACTSREVVGVVVREIHIQPSSANLTIGDSLQLQARVQDDRGEVLETALPAWESSGTDVAVVDPEGMVWGLRAGTVDIWATFGSVTDTAQITVTPPPVYGFLVLESSGSTVVPEGGDPDELTVVLLTEPAGDVLLDVLSADTGEVAVDSASLTFTPGDWSTPRTITVAGVVDGTVDGDQMTEVTVGVDPGSDPSYAGLPPRVVGVETLDVEVPGFSITETGGRTRVDEGESTDTIFVRLDARPESDVVLSVTSGDTGEVVVDPSTLVFTPADWDSAAPVTVFGVDDEESDGAQLTIVTIAIVDESSDALWVHVPDQGVEVETLEGPTGFAIVESDGGTSVSESGTEDTFEVVLNRQPDADVVLSVTVADPTEVEADKTTLTFKPSDWSKPRSVKVKGVDDPSVDGPQVTSVTVEVLPQSDPAFVGEQQQEVLVTTIDDDEAAFEVAETKGRTRVDEEGSTDVLRISLSARPLTDVILTVTSADPGEVVVDPTRVTFTPSDWDVTRSVTVVGVDDDEVDGSAFTGVTIAPDPSSDPAFVGLPPQTVIVETEDDERAHFEIIETGGSTLVTEGGSWDTFDVVLLYRPEWTVTIEAVSTDESEVTVSPSSITFSRYRWDDARTFTVTGVDDSVADGDQVTTILLQIVAPSWDDEFSDARDRTLDVTTIDDEGEDDDEDDDDEEEADVNEPVVGSGGPGAGTN